ncbi:hypothetical protein LY90DRAFT_673525 [Neocallimastix californiae]|uniref:Uncharacterized protein n=1 Tax=Neocallimastix californiae TaxID=1754190 RepID=A0A1Y2BE45_9FUNG|nr:hypothetical protein LY90DRAFT_673525 [Neocallimastix californiae]|eukprot:ORY32345.1 hypothetical protein LY90DRAFT_673525 [Neocallimastix californiae]
MAARFKPFISRNIGKITLAAFLTGTIISQQQCQRRIREIKRKEEEYWRGEVEELIHDAEHRGRMDELRRMTEYMVTPNSKAEGSMKGSKANEKPKLITSIQIPKKEEKTSLLFKKSKSSENNKQENIPVDENLDKMEKAMDNLENKIKLSAFNLTNKSQKSKDEKTEFKINEPSVNEDKNNIVITNNNNVPETKTENKGWFSWLIPTSSNKTEPIEPVKIEISKEQPVEITESSDKK